MVCTVYPDPGGGIRTDHPVVIQWLWITRDRQVFFTPGTGGVQLLNEVVAGLEILLTADADPSTPGIDRHLLQPVLFKVRTTEPVRSTSTNN